MKCVMCNNHTSGGALIFGIERNYKICLNCLFKYTMAFKVDSNPNYSTKQNNRYKTLQRKLYIQKLVDEKLNKYWSEV